MSDGAGSRTGVAGALGLSVTSSVAIVICNKYLISTLGFFFGHDDADELAPHGDLLHAVRCAAAALLRAKADRRAHRHLLRPAQRHLHWPPQPLPRVQLCWLLPDDQAGHHTLHHSLGNPLSEQEVQSIKASLMVLLLGVGIASVTDLQLNLLGSIIAVLTIAATCVGQILTNQIQRRLKVSSTQLLYQSSPYQSAVLLVTGPFVDKLLTKRDVFAFSYTTQVVVFILLSCSIAVCVNFSTFLVIGTTSPVTYQVLGHLKTCLVLSFGYIILKDPFSARNVVGILIAIFGMGLYSYYSVVESRKKTEDASSLPVAAQMSEKDSAPLLGAKSSPRTENKAEETFDYMPRTAKSAFTGR
ncbi:UDP-xylose transporter 1-like isoform X2 [Zea mays]|uniref:UDP-xylose transporter 1-like isoform X2 n=1 Tax=Zea mays TaxID=4577 RepID=UPI000182CDA9|nr:uncharacterized protein LOC100216974 isoform X2 [Zea mays]XP_035820241.1 uncharacterized protein LOC100216974 isoform X2 [Zea mays]